MIITPATRSNCRAIAELAMIAGEGIPAYFWEQSQQEGEEICDVGARNASSEKDNFSYRNAWLAKENSDVSGMLLAYRLPPADNADDPTDFPEFIRPLIELENLVPDSFYINMLACYPQCRGLGIGTALLAEAETQADYAGCALLSIQVFGENTGALRLYERMGYSIVDQREVIPHPYFRYTGKVFLLTKTLDHRE